MPSVTSMVLGGLVGLGAAVLVVATIVSSVLLVLRLRWEIALWRVRRDWRRWCARDRGATQAPSAWGVAAAPEVDRGDREETWW